MNRLQYDERLVDLLPGACKNGRLLNSAFYNHGKYVGCVMNRPSYDRCGDLYDKIQESRGLLDFCLSHAREKSNTLNPKDDRNLIILVHPLSLHQTDMLHLNDLTSREAEEYMNNLFGLFKKVDRKKAEIALFEDIHYYAAGTSLLLESGMVDRVVFSKRDCGEALNDKDLEFVKGRNVFITGLYESKCLSAAVRTVRDRYYTKKIMGIKDLALKSPMREGKSLKVDNISGLMGKNSKRLDEISSYLLVE